MSLAKRTAAPKAEPCRHCGEPVPTGAAHPGFCCAGCQFVHGLIAEQGLEKFYDLQNAPLPPAQAFVFQKRDYAWLAAQSALAEASAQNGEASLALDLQGISCLGCVWLVERLFRQRPGALAVEVAPALGRVELRWQPGVCDLVAFAAEVQRFGYLLGPVDEPGGTRTTRKGAGTLVKRMGLCGAFAMNAMLFTVPLYFGMTAQTDRLYTVFVRLAFLFATLAFVSGGSYFFKRAWRGLREGVLHLDLPIALGLVAAYTGSLYAWRVGEAAFLYFDFIATFTFLMLVGRWAQESAVEKNRNRLLARQAGPGEVTLLPRDGAPTRHAATALIRGDRYTVAPGGLVPVRSRLRSSAATLGLAWINGESAPHAAGAGQIIPSGAISASQEPVELEALEPWQSSLLCALMKIHPRMERHLGMERFLRGYILTVLIVAALGAAGWWAATGEVVRALQVLTSVLVVSCPCAVGIALPLADAVAAGRLRGAGVFIREPGLWQRILSVRKVVFDKTGTLTLETVALRNPETLNALSPLDRITLLALVSENPHPVSAALRNALLASGVRLGEGQPPLPHEVVGHGLELAHAGALWRLGRPGWHTPTPAAGVAGHDAAFSRNGVILATFHFAEAPRPDAAHEVAALRQAGCSIHLLSGDRPEKAVAMAKALGIPDAHGGLTPEQKASWLTTHDRHDTLFIGDGANDSLAFDRAHCTGTPTIEHGLLEHKADFYFLGRGLSGVRRLMSVARMRRRTVRRVVAFSITYNTVAVGLSLAGWMNPLLAAILMPISSLISLGIVFGTAKGK